MSIERVGHWQTTPEGRPVWIPAADRFQALREKLRPPIYEAHLEVTGPKRANVAAELRGLAHTCRDVNIDIQEYDLPKRFLQFQQVQTLITVTGEKPVVEAVVEALEEAIERYNRG